MIRHHKTRDHIYQRNALHAYLQHTPANTTTQCRARQCQQAWPCNTYLLAQKTLFNGVDQHGVPQWRNPQPPTTTRKPRPHPTITFRQRPSTP